MLAKGKNNMENKVREIIREILKEFVTYKDLKDIERYADDVFSDVNVDVEFTGHFKDRVNDPRNKKDIEADELKAAFKKSRLKHGERIQKMKDQEEAVINDPSTDINIPFVINKNNNGENEMVNKTIMRKKDFLTYTPKLRLEIRRLMEDILEGEFQNKKSYKTKIKLFDLYVDAENMYDAYHNSINTVGASSSSSDQPLAVTKLLDGTLLLKNGHHRISDKIKYLKADNLESIENLQFDAIVSHEDIESLEHFPDGEFWIAFIDWADSMEEHILKEDINIPINVGDEILGGKFKNKKVKVKEIGENDKGDITINGKPLLRFRIIKK